MNIILLGPPGCGKGTQAATVKQSHQLVHFSTGEIFRDEIARKTDLGRKVEGFVTGGRLVPDELVTQVITGKLAQERGGFLLDGFPRTLGQARALDAYLLGNGRKIDAVIYLSLAAEEVVRRLSARCNCSKCGELYNTLSKPSRTGDRCEKCGGAIVQREDDKAETIKKRLAVFEELTKPLVSYYRANGIFHEVAAAGSLEEVSGRVLKALEGL